MKTLNLKKFLIDKIDRDLIRDYKWHLTNSGYLLARVDGKDQYLHQIIAERMGLNVNKQIYHKNNNKFDLRRTNITDMSPLQESIRKNIQIDEWNMDFIRDYNWHFNGEGYLRARARGKSRYLHHLIAERMGLDPSKQVDHIDGNRENNHQDNLREATSSQNAMNKGIRSDNTSGVIGVSYNKKRKKWVAEITIEYKHIQLGRYKDKKDAITARKKAEIKYFGEYRRK